MILVYKRLENQYSTWNPETKRCILYHNEKIFRELKIINSRNSLLFIWTSETQQTICVFVIHIWDRLASALLFFHLKYPLFLTFSASLSSFTVHRKYGTDLWHEENTGSTLQDRSFGEDFLEKPPKAQEVRAKIDRRDSNKLRSFSKEKEVINSVRRLQTKWEKPFAHNTTKGTITQGLETQQQQSRTTLWRNGRRKWISIFQKSKFK